MLAQITNAVKNTFDKSIFVLTNLNFINPKSRYWFCLKYKGKIKGFPNICWTPLPYLANAYACFIQGKLTLIQH